MSAPSSAAPGPCLQPATGEFGARMVILGYLEARRRAGVLTESAAEEGR